MERKDAMQIVADIGGINVNGVTTKTNLLVVGAQDSPEIKNGKSTKQKKVRT